jgi:hypothetical protein
MKQILKKRVLQIWNMDLNDKSFGVKLFSHILDLQDVVFRNLFYFIFFILAKLLDSFLFILLQNDGRSIT